LPRGVAAERSPGLAASVVLAFQTDIASKWRIYGLAGLRPPTPRSGLRPTPSPACGDGSKNRDCVQWRSYPSPGLRPPDRRARPSARTRAKGAALSDPGGAGTRKMSLKSPTGSARGAAEGGPRGWAAMWPPAGGGRQRACSTVSSISTTKRWRALGSWPTASSCCARREAGPRLPAGFR